MKEKKTLQYSIGTGIVTTTKKSFYKVYCVREQERRIHNDLLKHRCITCCAMYNVKLYGMNNSKEVFEMNQCVLSCIMPGLPTRLVLELNVYTYNHGTWSSHSLVLIMCYTGYVTRVIPEGT